MNLTIKTKELQEMVGKVSKCVSNNKLIPLTSLMNIKVKDNLFTITTTDATNYFYSRCAEKVDCEDFEVSVIADLFSKLIQKTTSDSVTLSVEGGVLSVKGNGTYKMQLPLDENGGVIKFPKKYNDENALLTSCELKLSTVKNIIAVNKPSLATNMDYPALTNYYCADKVVTSDRKKVCCTDIKVFENPMLITPTLMELLGSVTEEDIQVSIFDDYVIFFTTTDVIYAPITDGVETFPVNAIENLVNQEFSSSCKISRPVILSILERLMLFVEKYDKNGIYLTFNNEGILLSSKKSSGQELIPYIASENFKPYTCCINIEMLRSQVATSDSEELELFYGSEVAIKLVNKNITQLVALLDEDRVEG